MESIDNIQAKIDSEDIEVLKLCNKFLDDRVESERLRGESAERRASILLGVVGAISAFMVFLANDILGNGNKPHVFLVIIYTASALWLARSVWYSMKSLRSQNRYRLTIESIFGFQSGSDIEALKKIIAGKYWEHEQSVQPNTERLFYIQRAQRSIVVVAGFLLCFGALIIMGNQLKYLNDTCVSLLASFILLTYWLFGDWAVEKAGIWNH